MDTFKIGTSTTERCACVKECGTEMGLESSVSLPEYFGDIVKVLRCTVRPVASAVTCGSGRITAEGTNHIRIVYTAENGGVYTYETSEPFSGHIDVSGCDGACGVVDRIWADSVVCRAVNPRRLDIRAVIRFRYEVYKKEPLVLVNEVSGGGLEAKGMSLRIPRLENKVSAKLTITENYDLPGGKADVNRVIFASAEASVGETKIISGKIMLKGEVTQKVLYMAEGRENGFESVRFTFPFSEIVDVPGIEDGMQTDIELHVLSAQSSMKPVQSGGMRVLENTVCLQAIVACGTVGECAAVEDVFSTSYETADTKVCVDACETSFPVSETFLTEGTFELSDLTPESVIDHECRIQSVKTSVRDGKIVVNGSIIFALLLATAAGSVGFVERNLDFAYEKGADASEAEPRFSPVLTISASSVNLNGGRAEVRAELYVEGRIEYKRTVSAVSNVELFEDRPKTGDGAGLILYFADKGESVWSIAKKYNTSPGLLARDNRLSEQTVPEKQILLISCV